MNENVCSILSSINNILAGHITYSRITVTKLVFRLLLTQSYYLSFNTHVLLFVIPASNLTVVVKNLWQGNTLFSCSLHNYCITVKDSSFF